MMPLLTSVEASAIGRARLQPLEAQVRSWVEVNSGTANVPGVAHMGRILADAFAALPGKIEAIDAEPIERVGPDGDVLLVDAAPHILITVRPHAPIQMLFTGHMDTVFGADHPFQTASPSPTGILNAPGAADMKGGLAVMLAALRAVEPVVGERLGYQVLLNSDEETGSLSSASLLAACARDKHAAFTYEPAHADGMLAGARSGSGNFSFVVRGKSAHAGRNPADGRNAIVAAAALVLELSELASATLSVNPAKVDGGSPNNVVPDLAILRVNLRPADAEAQALAHQKIAQITEAVQARYGVLIDVAGHFSRPAKLIDGPAANLFETVRKAGHRLGLDLSWRTTGGVCDGNNIAACGVPVVDTMGPVGGAIHSVEEYLVLDSLEERAALSVLSILSIVDQ